MGESVVILGAHGQLGRQLQKIYPDAWMPTRDEFCIHEAEKVKTLAGFDLTINCTAMHDLKECDQNPIMAVMTNAISVFSLGVAAQKLIHISTNYVFDGKDNIIYDEAASTNPINVYGFTKRLGENMLLVLGKQHLIVRTAGLYGEGGPSGKGMNFVDAIRDGKYTRVKNDEWINPTSCLDLARAIKRNQDKVGILHLVNQPVMTWHEFATMIRKDVEAVPSSLFDDGIKRPKYGGIRSRYDTGMMTVQEALEEYLG